MVDESVLDSPGVVTVETGVTLDSEDGFVYLSQSFARHLHPLHWLVSTAIILLAAATAVTDWQYVTGTGYVPRGGSCWSSVWLAPASGERSCCGIAFVALPSRAGFR